MISFKFCFLSSLTYHLFCFYIRLNALMLLFILRWDLFLLLYLSTVIWLINTFTLCIVQESIGDKVIDHAILSFDVDKRGHFSDDVFLENGNDFEGNDRCNYWVETFCEYRIHVQLDGSVVVSLKWMKNAWAYFQWEFLIVMIMTYKLV